MGKGGKREKGRGKRGGKMERQEERSGKYKFTTTPQHGSKNKHHTLHT